MSSPRERLYRGRVRSHPDGSTGRSTAHTKAKPLGLPMWSVAWATGIHDRARSIVKLLDKYHPRAACLRPTGGISIIDGEASVWIASPRGILLDYDRFMISIGRNSVPAVPFIVVKGTCGILLDYRSVGRRGCRGGCCSAAAAADIDIDIDINFVVV